MIHSCYMHYIVGLGNPGAEYENTRHNAGRMAVEMIAAEYAADAGGKGSVAGSFKMDKVLKALKAKADIDGESAALILPETFMNKSGQSVAPLIVPSSAAKPLSPADKKSIEKKAQRLIVIHDDLDLPLGQIKIVFDRGTGGHKGVESIVRSIKTEAFARIKIGVVPTTPTGKLKKPKGGEKVVDFILGKFQSGEMPELKKVLKAIPEIVAVMVSEGSASAMNRFN